MIQNPVATETAPELVVSFVHSSPQDKQHEGIHSSQYNQLLNVASRGVVRFDVAGDVYTFEDIYTLVEYFVAIVAENQAGTSEFTDVTGTEIFFRFIPETEYPLLLILSDHQRVQQIELSIQDIHELGYLFLRLVVEN